MLTPPQANSLLDQLIKGLTPEGRVGLRPNSLLATRASSLFGRKLGFRIVFAPARIRIICAAPWNRIGGASFVAHLRGQPAHSVLVEQVTQRAYGHLEELCGVGLVSFGASEGLEQVSLFKLIEVRRQV